MTSRPRRHSRAALLLILALGAAAPAARAQGPSPRPLSLDEALRVAEAESAQVTIARAAMQRAEGGVVQARSAYLPQLNSSLGYSRTIRFAPESRTRISDLQQVPLTVVGPQGPVSLPLGQIASVSSSLASARIDHLDRDRVINVEANTQGAPLSQVVQGIEAELSRIPVPTGYVVSQGGETESQREVFGSIFAALGIAVMLMYLILVVQFGSFLDPLAIMLSLPLSLIGVVLGLFVTGNTLNLMSMMGVILLMGIVAKNAILLIDFAKWSHEAGTPLREALIEAGGVRLRPILMTTFALVAGMMPVALGTGEGAQFRSPLGIAVIGGVITSTVLTLLVIPTFYEILSEWREWMMRRVFRRAGHPAHAAPPRALEPAFEPGD